MVHCLASSLYSGLSSEPGHCLHFFDTAPLSSVDFDLLTLRWCKFPRWSLWFPWQGPVEKFWHCPPYLHCPNYQLHKGERNVPKSFTMKDPAASLPRLWLQARRRPARLLHAPPRPATHYHLSVNFHWSSCLFSEFLSIAHYAPKITPRTGDRAVNKTRFQPSWNWSS